MLAGLDGHMIFLVYYESYGAKWQESFPKLQKIGVSATVRAIPIGLAGVSLRVFINFWVVPSDEQMNTT